MGQGRRRHQAHGGQSQFAPDRAQCTEGTSAEIWDRRLPEHRSSEEDIGEFGETPQPATGISTMVDEEAVAEPKRQGILSRISETINRRLDASVERRMERKASNASKKSQKKDSSEDQWSTPAPSSLTRSVVSCGACGALNNSGTPYCTSCGEFLT